MGKKNIRIIKGLKREKGKGVKGYKRDTGTFGSWATAWIPGYAHPYRDTLLLDTLHLLS